MDKDKKIKNDVLELGSTVAGALAGFVIGGPVGAVIGATTTPGLSLANKILLNRNERIYLKINNLIKDAFSITKLSDEKLLEELDSNTIKVDHMFDLLQNSIIQDPEMDIIFSNIIAQIIVSENEKELDRVIIIKDAIKNIRHIHIKILEILFNKTNGLEANEISQKLGISEIELRSVVRDLELRGMIKDLGDSPIRWEIRELGTNLIKVINYKKANV